MKVRLHSGGSTWNRATGPQGGSAVIVVIVILAIMMAFITFNARMLYNLNRDLKLVETKQNRHWLPPQTATNAPAMTNAPAAPVSTPPQ